jgi:general secretion pathway protein D
MKSTIPAKLLLALLGCCAFLRAQPQGPPIILPQNIPVPQQTAPTPAPQQAQQPAQQTAPQQTAPQTPLTPGPPVPLGNLNLQNASLTEVIDQMARMLKINYILDPRVKGGVILNTYGETRNLDARNLLELILRINNAGMVQEGDLYRIVPLNEINKQPLRINVNQKDIPEDDQTMLNLVFLKYVTVDELTKVLTEFTGENAKVYSYAPANLLFLLDSRRNMARTMTLISLFDNDTFANERVRLYELKNAKPSDMVKDLENVLKSISLDSKTSTVKFLPVDRISMLIAVAPNPGVFDTVETWIKKFDVPITVVAGAVDNYVYHVKYGRAECLAIALQQLFGSYNANGYGGSGYLSNSYAPAGGGYPVAGYSGAYGGGYGGSYGGGGYGGQGGGQWGSSNSFNGNFGGSGGCGNGAFGSNGASNGSQSFGYPTFGGLSAQTSILPGGAPVAGQQPAQASGPASPGAQGTDNPPRIVPNPLDNSLIIQADPQRYQSILKILKELDVPPRQILLEMKIYSVDLTDGFQMGISAYLQQRTGANRQPAASIANGFGTFTAGTLVGQSRELLTALSLSENATHAHMVSEPSLIATDSIPATINVGTQVPILTSQVSTAVQINATNAYNQSISSRNTGATLQVNARVNPSGIVTLIINQEISKPAAANPTGNALTPSFDQQVVQTQITMQDGDTIAIGGVISESTTSAISGIPGLVRIPYLGAIFGSKNYTKSRSELVLFVTPHVIYDTTTDLLEASDELTTRLKKLQKYFK